MRLEFEEMEVTGNEQSFWRYSLYLFFFYFVFSIAFSFQDCLCWTDIAIVPFFSLSHSSKGEGLWEGTQPFPVVLLQCHEIRMGLCLIHMSLLPGFSAGKCTISWVVQTNLLVKKLILVQIGQIAFPSSLNNYITASEPDQLFYVFSA